MVNLKEITKKDKQSMSVWDTLWSIKSIIPREQRRFAKRIISQAYTNAWMGLVWVGQASWVVSTSLLVLLVPLRRAIESEQAFNEHEQQFPKTSFATITPPIEEGGLTGVFSVDLGEEKKKK